MNFRELRTATPFLSALLLLSTQLSGCLSLDRLSAGLHDLHGKNTKEAFDVLGYPDRQQQFGDKTVYTWTTSSSAVVGGGAQQPTSVVPLSCWVKVVATASGTIEDTSFEGNQGACANYDSRFKRHSKSSKSF